MQSGKAQVQEIGGHAAKDKKKTNPNFHPVNNHPNKPRSVHTKFIQSWLINKVYHLSVNDYNKWEVGGLINFFPW